MVLEFIRAIVGFVFVLFLPGYVASWALFPGKEEVDWVERIALTLGLSIALSVLPVMFLNYFGVLVTAVNVFAIISAVILVSGIAAFWRMGYFTSK